jgi:hypothetical protein
VTRTQSSEDNPLGIEYIHDDLTRTDWWSGDGFDGVLSKMALMDIDALNLMLPLVS